MYKVADEAIEQGDPERLLSLNPADNPLMRFARYRLSPTASFGFDIATGKDAIGRPTGNPLHQPLEFTRTIARRALPIALQDIADIIPVEEEFEDTGKAAVSVPAEVLGLRSFPTSVFERRTMHQEELAQSFFGLEWDDLEPRQKRLINQQDEEMKHLNSQISAWGMERSDDVGVQVSKYFTEQQSIRDAYSADLQKAQDAFDAGQGDGKRFRAAAEEAGQRIGNRYEQLNSTTGGYDVALQEIATRYNRESDDPQAIEDIITDEYFNRIIIGNDEPEGVLHDSFGQYDFTERERRINDIKAKLLERLNGDEAARDEVWDTVRLRTQSSSQLPPLLEELRDGRDIFEAYWSVGERVAAHFNMLEIYLEYKRLGTLAAADEMKEQNPLLKRIDKQISLTRQQMRDKSPALDAFLLKFGYTSTLRNAQTMALGKAIIERQYSLELPLQ
jgi:hypothetical protein